MAVVALVGDAPQRSIRRSQFLHRAFPRLKRCDWRGEVEADAPSLVGLFHGDDHVELLARGPLVSGVEPEAAGAQAPGQPGHWGQAGVWHK